MSFNYMDQSAKDMFEDLRVVTLRAKFLELNSAVFVVKGPFIGIHQHSSLMQKPTQLGVVEKMVMQSRFSIAKCNICNYKLVSETISPF
jgi:hypothetical protein